MSTSLVRSECSMTGTSRMFLDVSVILYSNSTIKKHIYYKDTDVRNYFPYDSTNPDHSRNNIPYNLAKRLIIFVSNKEKIKFRSNELKNWLKSCKYDEMLLTDLFLMQDYKIP